MTDAVRKFAHWLYALCHKGHRGVLREAQMKVTEVGKLHESSENNILTLIESERSTISSPPPQGQTALAGQREDYAERQSSARCRLTSVDTANALADSLLSRYSQHSTELVGHQPHAHREDSSAVYQDDGTSNDYIYFNCMEQEIIAP